MIHFPFNVKRAEPPNARHHPPPQEIEVDDKQRVGGRVHAVVRLRRVQKLSSWIDDRSLFEASEFVEEM